MVSANKLIETSLLLLSSCSILWSSQQYDYLSAQVVCLCLSSVLHCTDNFWNTYSRKGSGFIMWYGSVFVPVIINVINKDKKYFISCNIASTLFFIFFLQVSKAIKCSLLFLTIFFGYFVFCVNISSVFIWFTIFAIFLIFYFGCTNSFSIGEAFTVSQLVTFYIVTWIKSLRSNSNEIVVALCFLLGAVTCLYFLLLVASFVVLNSLQNVYRLLFITGVSALFLFLFNPFSFKQLVIFAFDFFMHNQPTRLFLLIFWIGLIVLCLVYTVNKSSKKKASTAERKLFHVFILLVYFSGLMCDIPLLFLCSVAVFCFFTLTSLICAFKLKPAADYLIPVLQIFTDKQDQGLFILTPIYLVFGLSFPIWVFFYENQHLVKGITSNLPLICFSGILSVGIGDACASVVGSKYGSRKISGTNKTFEGAISSVFAQLVAVFCLSYYELVQVNFIKAVFAVSIVSFTESSTDEIDNLVLPILMYALLL